jgi:hypothetical protein
MDGDFDKLKKIEVEIFVELLLWRMVKQSMEYAGNTFENQST